MEGIKKRPLVDEGTKAPIKFTGQESSAAPQPAPAPVPFPLVAQFPWQGPLRTPFDNSKETQEFVRRMGEAMKEREAGIKQPEAPVSPSLDAVAKTVRAAERTTAPRGYTAHPTPQGYDLEAGERNATVEDATSETLLPYYEAAWAAKQKGLPIRNFVPVPADEFPYPVPMTKREEEANEKVAGEIVDAYLKHYGRLTHMKQPSDRRVREPNEGGDVKGSYVDPNKMEYEL